MGWTWTDSVNHYIHESVGNEKELKELKEDLQGYIKKIDRTIQLGIVEDDPDAPCYMVGYEGTPEEYYVEKLDSEGTLDYLKEQLEWEGYPPDWYHFKTEIIEKDTGNVLHTHYQEVRSEN